MGTGDVFKLGKGSKIAIAGIKGDAFIDSMSPTSAQFRIRGKAAFFLNVDARVSIDLLDNDVVRLHASGKGVPELTANGRVSEQRTNLLRVAPLELRVRDTSIERINDNTVLIDFEHPTLGVAHLVLERQPAPKTELAR
jgi:hypothetical protein